MKALIVANWKMNPRTLREATKLFETTKKLTASLKNLTLQVAPPAIYLQPLSKLVRAGRVSIGIQNVHFEERGSYTGEISIAQAKDSKASFAIIGHAERRMMGEGNEDVRKKVKAAIEKNITPIVCVGEKERGADAAHFEVVRTQLQEALLDVPEKKIGKVVIAYEPVWAIGATKAMSPRDMHEMSIFIRKTIVERFGNAGHSIKILYGGAVDATNVAGILREGDVSGLLVGRASVDSEALTALLTAASAA